MSIINEGKNVITCEGIVLWDGLTTPDTDERTGAPVHNLTIAIPENAPETAEIEALAQRALDDSEFKGQRPANAKWPIKTIEASRFGKDAAMLAGRVAVTARTRNGAPQVFDTNGQELNAMQYGKMLYPGAVVKLLIHAYAYNATGNKGVSAGLDGVQIVDTTTPKLDVGGGMSAGQVAAAFGATQATAAPPPAAVEPHHGFVANAGSPVPPPAPAAPQHVMLPAANGATYEAMIAAGWTDELLVQHGMMQG